MVVGMCICARACVCVCAGVCAVCGVGIFESCRQFPVDDLLFWFRVRSGVADPAGASWGWDNGGPDKPYGLRGSVAGAFLMGTGGAVRWQSNATLESRLRRVVAGIAAAKDNSTGYMMAFPMNESIYHENPNCTSTRAPFVSIPPSLQGPACPPSTHTHTDPHVFPLP